MNALKNIIIQIDKTVAPPPQQAAQYEYVAVLEKLEVNDSILLIATSETMDRFRRAAFQIRTRRDNAIRTFKITMRTMTKLDKGESQVRLWRIA